MRILHYFLGFPPYRSGGLTKYAFDLAKSQAKDGHVVMAMWPGEIKKYSDNPEIKKRKKIKGILNFELINPLPVPLDEGIKEFSVFTKSCDIEIYKSFLKKENPEVIHIHTLMGIHIEFIKAANQLGIRTVFTSHDYFGICPKVTLFRNGKCCDNDNECRNCIQCNESALSLKKIKIIQSPIYRFIKNIYIVKKLRKSHRNKFFNEENCPSMPDVDIENVSEKYRNLRSYYVEMLESIDFIHFNSTLAEEIYRRYISPKDSKVISIVHQGIKKQVIRKVHTGKKVILYLAPTKPYKGWNILKKACDQLWQEDKNIQLRVFSPVQKREDYMIVKEEGFKQDELAQIMSKADMLVAPSIWYETFGFTVIEALSFGVPVIVSDHVGAKDVIGNNGFVVQAGNVDELKNAIKNMDKKVNIKLKTWREFLNENYRIYKNSK